MTEIQAKVEDLNHDGMGVVKEQGIGYMDLCGRKLVDAAVAVLIGYS